VDPLGTITRWNRKTAVLTGIPCHEAMGSHMDDLLKCSKDALDTIKSTMTKSIMGHRVDPFQMVLISRGGLDGFEETIKEGDELLFFVGPNVSRDLTGRARDVLFVGQDVTDVRKTMVKCLEIEAGYQRVIAESGSPIFGVSTDGSITDWNCATEAITKISSKTALGMPFLGKSGVFGGLLPLLHNGVETELEVFVSTTLEAAGLKTPEIKDSKVGSVKTVDKAKDSSQTHFEFSFIDSAGATIDFMIMATCPKTGSEDNLAQKSIVFFALNITEKRALQAANVAYVAAEAASNAKTDQIGFLCHELRNPLNGVMGNISLLEECGLGENEAELVDSTLQCCTQLMRIMNDVLDMSKVEQGKLEIERIVFDISKIVDAVTSQIRIAAEGKNLEVSVIYSGFDKAGHYFLESDPVRVQQIISNFAWNAIKFTESGKIVIKVSSKACEVAKDDPGMHTVTISVTDTGVGISRTSISKLFQPYTQAEKSTSRQYGGTGLGLSICKQLAHLLGGEVGVESTVGKGSMFYLSLHEKKVSKPVDEKSLSITSQAPRWRPDRSTSRPVSHSPSPVGQLMPLTEATEVKDLGGNIDEVLNTGPSLRRKKAVDWNSADHHDDTVVDMTMLDLGVSPEAVLAMLDPKWSSKVVRESRDGNSLMVLLEVSLYRC
jgi:signal transduction histidine kinase